ncbi:MAG: RNA-binding S4 domain-containing protein [Alphaproteobacteria bacterium]|nr:RNA-binding S4 domain-containing protein [Alphaproteobacteria bacterium]
MSGRRIDQWLWYARFFKSRTGAAEFCAARRLRLNRQPIDKPSQPVKPGDVLTFPLGPHVRVIRVRALGERRCPPAVARQLYDDLAPPETSG